MLDDSTFSAVVRTGFHFFIPVSHQSQNGKSYRDIRQQRCQGQFFSWQKN